MPWSKPLMLWAHPLGNLTATSTESGYDVKNLIDRLEGTFWKATSTADQYIYFKPMENGGFETGDFTNWTQNSSAIESTTIRTGSYSSKLVASGSDADGAESDPVIVRLGAIATIKGYHKVTVLTTGDYICYVKFYGDEAGTDYITKTPLVTHSSTVDWTLSSKTVGAINSGADIEYPAGTKAISVEQAWWNSAGDPDGTAFMDDLSVSFDADYLFIWDSNFYKGITGTIVLQHSDDDVSYSDAFTAYKPATRNIYKALDASTLKPFRRLKISGFENISVMSLCYWGLKAEWDYMTSSFDPDGVKEKVNINIGETGVLLGAHEKYYEQDFAVSLSDAEDATYKKTKEWKDETRLLNAGWLWEETEHSEDLWLMRLKAGSYRAPLTKGGLYRNIRLTLTGRQQT